MKNGERIYVLKETGIHSCNPMPGQAKVKQKIQELLDKAGSRPEINPSAIISELNALSQTEQAQVSLEGFSKTIQHKRKKNEKFPKAPKSKKFEIPDIVVTNAEGDNILLWDSGKDDTERIIILGSKHSVDFLSTEDELTDCTFQMAP